MKMYKEYQVISRTSGYITNIVYFETEEQAITYIKNLDIRTDLISARKIKIEQSYCSARNKFVVSENL